MKILKLSLMLFVFGAFFACSNAPEGEKAEATEAKEEKTVSSAKNLALTMGKITWVGSKPGGQHTGTLNVTKGKIAVDNNQVVGGEFIIDINSINVTDLEGEYKAKLEGHLKTGDFFETEKYPIGKFAITEVKAVSDIPDVTHHITGNLTLKSIVKSVTIPANVAMMGDQLSVVTPSFTINRTEWGITYSSGVINTAKDKLINDEIGLVIELKAGAAPVQ